MSSALGAESLSGKTNKRGTMKNGKSDVYGGDKKETAVNPGFVRCGREIEELEIKP
jgi:hypothetical protein